jgi:hypothetical protein
VPLARGVGVIYHRRFEGLTSGYLREGCVRIGLYLRLDRPDIRLHEPPLPRVLEFVAHPFETRLPRITIVTLDRHVSLCSCACAPAVPDCTTRLGPHVCSVTVSKQESRFDERTERRIARGAIQAPQSLRLCLRQAKSRHLEIFALNTPKDVLKLLLLY